MDNIKILEKMFEEHRGKENAITSGEISERFGGIDQLDSTPNTRKMIRRLVEKGVPIAACSKGYFVIEDEEELDEYQEKLQSRASGILDRKKAVTEAFM